MTLNQPQSNSLTWFDQVFEVARQIPVGKVTTYGAIARYLGTAKSSRMVGWAMNQAHQQAKYVPAHRVVNRAGLLTGKHHFPTQVMMQELLENEGLTIENDQIRCFSHHFWDPSENLKL